MNMSTLKFAKFALVLVILSVSSTIVTQTLFAQLPPPLSPWLSLFNENRGVLDNYNEYVRPKQDMYKAFQDQQRQLQMQGSQQSIMQNQMRRVLDDSAAGDGVLSAPRTTPSIGGMSGAGFRQYMHYYQGGLQQGGVPNFSSPGQRR